MTQIAFAILRTSPSNALLVEKSGLLGAMLHKLADTCIYGSMNSPYYSGTKATVTSPEHEHTHTYNSQQHNTSIITGEQEHHPLPSQSLPSQSLPSQSPPSQPLPSNPYAYEGNALLLGIVILYTTIHCHTPPFTMLYHPNKPFTTLYHPTLPLLLGIMTDLIVVLQIVAVATSARDCSIGAGNYKIVSTSLTHSAYNYIWGV